MKRAALAVTGLGLGLLLGVGAALATPPRPASAHPLGNFSVNQLDAFDLYPDRIEVGAEVDIAELPTLQDRSNVDSDGDGSASGAELAAYAAATCPALAHDLTVTAGGRPVAWTVTAATFGYAPGAAGLSTSRLHCALRGPAALGAATTVTVANRYRADRVGWREMTAVGHGVRLVDSALPAQSVSGGLTAYPKDLLSSPLDVRSATLHVAPGRDDGSRSGATTAAPTGSWTNRLTAGADRYLQVLVGGKLTPLVGVLAVLLALVLGAAHAALPGHGKTVMAAYLAGKRGRRRDALAVGATVTLTHTGGVLVLGVLLTSVASLAGERVLGWLGVLSGALVVSVGAVMLTDVLRRRRRAALAGHDHHGHEHHGHEHHGHEHHGHDHGGAAPSRLGILGIGVAGGLVPSPSALVILLGAIGLGRTGFGVLLVLAYGVGMAATLTAAGLLLIIVRDRWARRAPRWSRTLARFSAAAPTGTALLVCVVGLGLAGRALATLA